MSDSVQATAFKLCAVVVDDIILVINCKRIFSLIIVDIEQPDSVGDVLEGVAIVVVVFNVNFHFVVVFWLKKFVNLL